MGIVIADEDLKSLLRGDGESPKLDGIFDLDRCLEIALENNRQRPASRFAVAIARAQHRQALSAYWPQVSLHGLADFRGDEPNFIYPESTFGLPDMALALPEMNIPFPGGTIQTPASSLSIPQGAFGPNFPPAEIQVPVPPQQVDIPGQLITVPSQEFALPGQELTVPEQEIDLADRFTYGALLEIKWLLFDGGMRQAMREQAKQGIAAARQDARRADHEIVYEVTRMYHGAVLAQQLVTLGDETLERMEITLALTEQLYKGGSMQVKKTDFLRNKVIVDSLRMLVERLRKNRALAQSALVHSMGLSWESEVKPSDGTIAYGPHETDLRLSIAQAFQSSPQWSKLQIGVNAAEAKVREERSAYLPKIAFLGSAHYLENGLDTGAASKSNLQNWSVGIGMELPLFTGFRNKERINEARARLGQIKAQRELMRQGLALQVKNLFLKIQQLESQETISTSAVETATENRSLAERSYRNDLIEAREVFESQLMEAMMKARRHKLHFEHVATVAQLDQVVGKDTQLTAK